MDQKPHSRPHSLFPSQHLTSQSSVVANPVQALKVPSVSCLQSTSSQTASHSVLCRSHCALSAGAADRVLAPCFLSFLLLPRLYFLWLERQVFVLGQSVPPPRHLPGGFPEKPEVGIRRATGKIAHSLHQNQGRSPQTEGREHVTRLPSREKPNQTCCTNHERKERPSRVTNYCIYCVS